MKLQFTVPTRAGLAGNPSDGYGGRAVAVALSGFSARASIEPATGFYISSPGKPPLTYPSAISLAEDASVAPGSPHRLAVAVCQQFLGEAVAGGWLEALPGTNQGFRLTYESDIPRQVGLAGSSAIVVASLRALLALYDLSIPDEQLAPLALRVETERMGIHGGLMDRIAQVYGGLTYMDLSRAPATPEPAGLVEILPDNRLPDLYIAWHPELAAGSDTVHNDLRERVRAGAPGVSACLRELASLADEARRALLDGSGRELQTIMDKNFELRARLIDVGAGNRRLVQAGRQLGAGVKQAGSGGAVVGAYDGDPDRLESLRRAYDQIGARFHVPAVWKAPKADSTTAGAGRLPDREGPREGGETGAS